MHKTYVLLLLFFVAIISMAYADEAVYSISLNYSKGDLLLDDLSLIQGAAPSREAQVEEGYSVKVLSFNGAILYSFKFLIETTPHYALPEEWFDERGNQIYFPEQGIETSEDTSINLIIPYFKNAKTIEIYGPDNQLLLSVDVSNYATCNFNFICEERESFENCPEDCKETGGIVVEKTFFDRIKPFLIMGGSALGVILLYFIFVRRFME